MQPPTKNGAAAALRFFFTTTCSRPEMTRDPYAGAPAAEAAVGSDAGGGRAADRGPRRPKYKAALAVAYGAGLRVIGGCKPAVSDIDSERDPGLKDPQIESAIKVKVNDLALPSELREANNVNGLRKGLGKKRVIEVQGVSDRAPKPCSQGGQARGPTCRTRRRQFANGLGGAIHWPVRPRANWPRSVPHKHSSLGTLPAPWCSESDACRCPRGLSIKDSLADLTRPGRCGA